MISEENPPQRRRLFPRLSLALSAFIMSLAVTLISAYYALQGAEILVRPPEQILLYRDGEGEGAVLGFALRLDMINGASDYGDVMLDAQLAPAEGAPSFGYQSVMKPIFTNGSQDAAKNCDLGSRCTALPGLLLVERPEELVDIPGGAAKAMHLSFPATDWNCKAPSNECSAFGNFDKAVSAIEKRPLDVRITLHFHRDGTRRIRCKAGRLNAAYLRAIGWISLACTSSKVTGAPLL